MSALMQILPGTGRWQCAALTKGGLLSCIACYRPPSTTFGVVPLPVKGEDL